MKLNLRFFIHFVFMFFLLQEITDRCLAGEQANSNCERFRLVKIHYRNSSGEEGLTTLLYDKDGIFRRAHWQLKDESRSSENIYTYNDTGILVKKFRKFSDGLTSTQVFIYDQQNKLIEEYYERSDGRSGKVFYQHSENGKLLKSECEGLNGWFYGLIAYQYDSTGHKQSAIIEKEGQQVGLITYQYDNDGNMIEETWKFQRGWQQQFSYEYERVAAVCYFLSNPFLIRNHLYRVRKETYDYASKIGGPSHYYYDLSGKLLQKTFKRSDNFSTRTTYEYQPDGALHKSLRRYSNGLTAEFQYKYSNNGKMLSRSFVRSDGLSGYEKYTYHADGLLQYADYTNVDGWLSGRIIFAHDTQGRLHSAHFAGEKIKADIRFEYDREGNLSSIVWSFADGTSQTYKFEYERITTMIKF